MNTWRWAVVASLRAAAGLAGSVVMASSRLAVPIRAEIQGAMHTYHEAAMAQETYQALWKTVTRSYRRGVVDTAVVAMRWPTARDWGNWLLGEAVSRGEFGQGSICGVPVPRRGGWRIYHHLREL